MANVAMKYVDYYGKRRLYIKPYPLSQPIPTLISEVPSFEEVWFMEHIVMNHRGTNWISYRHKVDANSYKVFIYSFAYLLYVKNPEDITCWQFEANAKLLEKILRKKRISLSFAERSVLRYSQIISKYSWSYNKKVLREKSILLCEILRREYGW